MGVFVPGNTATFCAPPGKPAGEAKGPVIPGPLTKKANTSLNTELMYVRYSSEEKTKLKPATFEEGTKSNSRIAASFVELMFPDWGFEVTDCATDNKPGSDNPLPGWPASAVPAAPTRPVTGPAAKTIPEFNPMFELWPSKVPI